MPWPSPKASIATVPWTRAATRSASSAGSKRDRVSLLEQQQLYLRGPQVWKVSDDPETRCTSICGSKTAETLSCWTYLNWG